MMLSLHIGDPHQQHQQPAVAPTVAPQLQIQQLFGPTGVGAGAGVFQRALFELEDPPALRLQPLDMLPLMSSRVKKYKSGNFKQALEHCNIIYEKNPRRTHNLLLLSAIYYQMHDFDMCITKNEEALAVNPRFAECYGNTANAWKEQGNVDLAIRYYLYAIEDVCWKLCDES